MNPNISRGLLECGRRVNHYGARIYRVLARTGHAIRHRWFSTRLPQPLYGSPVLDDLLFAQPVNSGLRIARWMGRLQRTREGVTVVIVNFNTLELLRTVLSAIRRFSPPGLQIIIIDNASSDGSREWLRQKPFGVRPIYLPVNIDHGRALDLGLFAARTSVVVTLDSDAFPYSNEWLDVLLEPLTDSHILASGCWGRRDRLHPACAAYRRSSVLATNQSFQNFPLYRYVGQKPVFGENTWDTGELLFEALGREHVCILPVTTHASGWGKIMADVVYHHEGMTTGLRDDEAALLAYKRVRWNAVINELIEADNT